MGAGYGVLQGLTSAVTGIGQGQEKGRAQVDAMRARALQDSLMKHQITNLEREPKGEWTAHFDDQGNGLLVNTATGETKPVPGKMAPKEKSPPMGSPAWLKAQRDLAGIHNDAKNAVVLTPAEKRNAKQASDALKGMKALYAKDKTAIMTPWQVPAAEGLGRIPVIGGPLHGLAGPAAQKQMTPNQREFQRLATAFRHTYPGILAHSRQSLGIMQDANAVVNPPAGVDDEESLNNYAAGWDPIIETLDGALGGRSPGPSRPTGAGIPVTPTPAPPASPAVAGKTSGNPFRKGGQYYVGP